MLSVRRIVWAIILGAAGCLFIWLAAPYNNFFLNNSYISDTYFPVAGTIFMLILVLAVNPLLRCVRGEWTLNSRQLMLIFAILLAAAVVPSQGLLRMLPWSLARTNQDINLTEPLAEAIEKSTVNKSLFPDPVGFEKETPVSDQFLDQLGPESAIPWGSWVRMLLVWGVFLLACWMLMIGTGLILFPEWRDHERLPFPLLGVYRSLLPEDGSERVLPPMFRDKLFWTGAAVVMLLYALNGLNHHTSGGFPGFPLGWRLSSIFTEEPWRYLRGAIKNVGHIYFILVGMAFFMPNRVGFSIWFTTLAYGVIDMCRIAYMPTAYRGMVTDHRNGAMIAIALSVLFLSRRHWARVGKLMFSKVNVDSDRLLKVAGWMLAAGALGMFLWLKWAGVPHIWAVVFVFIGFVVSLLVARIVAETGMPFVRITGLNPSYFMSMLPAGWVTGAAIYISGFISIIFPLGSRVSATVMISQAAGLDEKASARHQLRLGYMMIAVLLIGLIVCGAIHLHMGYSHTSSIDGVKTPLCMWGANRMKGVQNQLVRWSSDYWPGSARRFGHLMSGVGLAGVLQVACMMIPRWPLHPVGLLLVGHYYSDMSWASILIGWTIKVFIIHFWGAAAFRRAKPLFLGIIMGEIFSAVIWTLVPVVLILMGYDPADVGHIPLLPT